jgi:hypothetical protein
MAYADQMGESPVADAAPAPQGKEQGFTIADLPGHINIAELLPEARLTEIGMDTWTDYDIDKKSRKHKELVWDAVSAAFAMTPERKDFPFANAANVKYPILLQACLQFAARAMPAIIHDGKIAKGKVIGKEYEQPQPMAGPMGPPPGAPPMPVPSPGMGEAAPMDQMPPMGLEGPPMGGPDNPIAAPSPPPQKPTKQDRADRVSGYMNWQLLDRDTAWVVEQDQMLHQLPGFGTAVKKVYRDPVFGNKSELVSVRDFVVNAAYPSLDRAPRCTQRFDLYPNEIEERKRDGRYLPLELINTILPKDDADKKPNAPEIDSADKSAPHEFLEQHRLIDIDEDGYAEPYCVTLHVPTKKVVRITASYGEKDIILKDDGSKTVARIKPYRYFVMYTFIPDPDGGPYGLGFGDLLMHPVEVINAIINTLINTGVLNSTASGFIGKEFRLKSGSVEITPGKFPQVPFAGDDIRKAIVPLQFPEPSSVLFQLLGFLVEQTEKIVSSPEVLSGEAPGNQPATTTLALIEQGLKVFTGIIGRVLRALGHELKCLYDLNARYIEEDEAVYFNYGDDEQYVMGRDFNAQDADVIPIADATQSTDMQRLAKAEMIVNAMTHPVMGPLINPVEGTNRYFEAMGVSTSNLVADQMPPPQPDPQMAKVDIEKQKLDEIDKPMAELDGALKQVQLFQALAALPPELQALFGIDPPIQPMPNPAEEQGMAHKDEAHRMTMEGQQEAHRTSIDSQKEAHQMNMASQSQKMEHADQKMDLARQKAEQPIAQ